MPTAPALRYPYPMGALRPLRDDPLAFMVNAFRDRGDVVRFRLGPYPTMLFRHPDAVKRILVDNHANYDKQTRGWDLMRRMLGQGLLTSEGAFWRRQRRIAQPAFHRKTIAGFGETMVTLTENMLDRWEDLAALGRSVDVAAQMHELALRIVGRTLFGTEVGQTVDAVSRAVTIVNAYANEATTGVMLPPWLVPSRRNLQVMAAIRELDEIVLGIIDERRRKGGDPGDLLSMLMHATDAETGESMSDRQLRDEVLTVFLAGHETTANALAWTLYLLSTHPAVHRRLVGELRSALGERRVGLDDLPALGYLEQVLSESMRLYPPAWMLDRRCVADDEISGYRVPAGTLVLISSYVTHRHDRWWPNPEGFDPDRFAPGLERERPRWAYFPFGGGPRRCIGAAFATMESQLVLATILRRFALWLEPGHVVEPAPLITLRPHGGLPMEIHGLRDMAA